MFDCDDLSHQHTEPLRIKEVQITQLRLYIIVMQEHPTLMEEIDCLQREIGKCIMINKWSKVVRYFIHSLPTTFSAYLLATYPRPLPLLQCHIIIILGVGRGDEDSYLKLLNVSAFFTCSV